MRRPFVAGNWKMNLSLASARELISAIRAKLVPHLNYDVAVCPPFPYLFPVAKAIAESPIKLGAQNLWPEDKGAFTGEVSPLMLKDTGCTYVILGHSERRHTIGPRDAVGRVCGEDDGMVNRKTKAALATGLVPIVCIGETLSQRDAGQTEDVLTQQLSGSLAGLKPEEVAKLVVAYEPVWAIGTGRNATPQQAAEAHHHIRQRLISSHSKPSAEAVRILYGGSVKASNAAELMASPDVDGALVGGASLVADDFLGIMAGCVTAKRLK